MLCFFLSECIPVPIVIVAYVVLVQPGHWTGFILCAHPLVVPVDYPFRPIGIQRRDVQEDDIVLDLLNLFIIG